MRVDGSLLESHRARHSPFEVVCTINGHVLHCVWSRTLHRSYGFSSLFMTDVPHLQLPSECFLKPASLITSGQVSEIAVKNLGECEFEYPQRAWSNHFAALELDDVCCYQDFSGELARNDNFWYEFVATSVAIILQFGSSRRTCVFCSDEDQHLPNVMISRNPMSNCYSIGLEKSCCFWERGDIIFRDLTI